MKNLIFPLVLAVLAVTSVSAQDRIFYAKLKTSEVPAEVITACAKDLEDGMTVTEYRALPLEMVEEGWFVNYNKDIADKDYNTYEVRFSGNNLTGEATYDANGNLISFVENVEDVALPRPIQKSIGKNFEGWAVANDHEIVTINKNNEQKVYYRVNLIQGKEKKRVIFDGDGNLVKVNREHVMIRKPDL